MKKYTLLIISILCLFSSFIWMVLAKESNGGILVLAAISDGIISEGICQIERSSFPIYRILP